MRSIIMGLVVIGGLASAGRGFADSSVKRPYTFALPTDKAALAHLKRGFRLYNNREFSAAIEEFKAGSLVEQCSSFDYDLGQAYRQLGQYKEALWHYERFLNDGKPTGEVLEAVEKWIAEMKAHLADAARSMPPTEAAPTLSGLGMSQSERSATARGTTAPSALGAQRLDATPTDDRVAATNWIGWGATGVGIAAIGASAYLFLRSSQLDDQANASLGSLSRNDLHDQASTRRIGGAIVGAAGLVVTAVGVYMLATHSPHRDRAITRSLDVGVSRRGLVVFGRF